MIGTHDSMDIPFSEFMGEFLHALLENDAIADAVSAKELVQLVVEAQKTAATKSAMKRMS